MVIVFKTFKFFNIYSIVLSKERALLKIPWYNDYEIKQHLKAKYPLIKTAF